MNGPGTCRDFFAVVDEGGVTGVVGAVEGVEVGLGDGVPGDDVDWGLLPAGSAAVAGAVLGAQLRPVLRAQLRPWHVAVVRPGRRLPESDGDGRCRDGDEQDEDSTTGRHRRHHGSTASSFT
jgi:hypothetical protein